MTLAQKRSRKQTKRKKLKATFKSPLGDRCWAQREMHRNMKRWRKDKKRQIPVPFLLAWIQRE